MAPKAPIGAAFMMKLRILNIDAGQALHAVQDGGADLAHGVQGDAEDDGDEDDLQDVALNEGADHAVRG